MTDYRIVVNKGEIEACAKFKYKNHEVSFSTMGYQSGGCRNPVVIFKKYDRNKYNKIGEFHKVEDAIKWLDGDDSVTDYMGNPVVRN